MAESDQDREDALRAIADRYAWYEQSGYAGRWGGMALAIDERDRWLIECLGQEPLGAVLDVGCADGTFGQLLDRHGLRPASLDGVDLLPHRVEQASSAVPWGTFVAASADALPYRDGTFDLAVAMTLFSSLPHAWLREGAAREIGRALRPGGRAIIYDLRYRSPGNPAIQPLTVHELRRLFPGWEMQARTLTLLPPLARSPLARGRRAYRVLSSIPFLRSHLGVVLVKPA